MLFDFVNVGKLCKKETVLSFLFSFKQPIGIEICREGKVSFHCLKALREGLTLAGMSV